MMAATPTKPAPTSARTTFTGPEAGAAAPVNCTAPVEVGWTGTPPAVVETTMLEQVLQKGLFAAAVVPAPTVAVTVLGDSCMAL